MPTGVVTDTSCLPTPHHLLILTAQRGSILTLFPAFFWLLFQPNQSEFFVRLDDPYGNYFKLVLL